MEFLFSENFWKIEYFNNALWEYLVFLITIFALSLGVFIAKYIFLRKVYHIAKNKKISKLLFDIIDKIRSPFYIFFSFYVALSIIEVPSLLFSAFFLIFLFWTTYRVVIVGYQCIDFFLNEYVQKNVEKGSKAMVRALGNIAKGILWVFAGLIVLSILGVNVTGVIAGMGIGGVAIAFALQGILGDLFSSFSIYVDRPFIEGDFIVIGDKYGTVEKIGLKSTRIRALQGEEIIFSNQELTSAQVHNLKNMEKRRTSFRIGIVYETPSEKMEKIPEIIKNVTEEEDLVDFDRVHFCSFGDFSLDYEIVYFVKSGEYIDFMSVNERVMLNIKKKFEKEGIEFAYPTKTVHLFNQKN